ncbi:SDR family oxidoreductase [Halanaerobium congolense]|jgi:nucleoside-diphosphate-sugar epimerase|uniref:SDR family oxidoreductase n=1 Tax=Halanaerobium congolense TaxID=54121 RepID=UPI0009195540|nr:SDR family oxidoreductase [Halanaerobium congolense]SHM90213.1 Nucleoside-diphosphate-sugar epimerase [Halanaerobium congolense]
MKVLFIGGTGTISQAVSELAVKKGIELYLFNRGNNNHLAPKNAKIIEGNIRNPKDAAQKLKDYKFDVIVDWVAFDPEHVKNDIEIFRDKTDQYIFISSASAYQKPQTSYLIDESTPLSNPYWEYSQKKIACENILMAEYRKNDFPITIVRPSHTYGKTSIPAAINSSKAPWTLIDRMRKGKKILVHGDGSSLWTMTHNSDFAKAFIGLIGNIQAVGHAFQITSDESLNWNQIYKALAAAAGVDNPKLVHVTSRKIAEYNDIYIGKLLGDKAASVVFDNSKIKRFVPSFKAIVPFAEGVKDSINWYDSHPELQRIDQDWNDLMDKIIEENESKYSNL